MIIFVTFMFITSGKKFKLFNMLFYVFVIGESGLGKSTLINSLFLTDLYAPDYPGPSHRIKKTVQVSLFKCTYSHGESHELLVE